jgi:predicted ATPase
MKFLILPRDAKFPDVGTKVIYLTKDNWNDFSYVTMFHMALHDENGHFHKIGEIKIGFKGQTSSEPTYSKLGSEFESLNRDFFSLGQDVDFYRKIASLNSDFSKSVLFALNDLVSQPGIIDEIKNEEVFSTSFLRGISLATLKGQFVRVLEGRAALSNFRFKFIRPEESDFSGLDLSFNVKVESTPSTNIHAIIGRNGVGKTTLLNGMIKAITSKDSQAKFVDNEYGIDRKIPDDYFSSLVSVSFSAFDPFTPPQEQPDPSKGTCYFYIGLKDSRHRETHRTIKDLQEDCVRALINCFYKPEKTLRWLNAIEKLGSDENFSSMKLGQLEFIYREVRKHMKESHQSDSEWFRTEYKNRIESLLSNMSSGHAIVLLIITSLVSKVEEKTLVLLDEPESHLHPPLLSAFLRALADLLDDQNAVAVIATHSPVVLQEIPKSCVWKIYRIGASVEPERPTIETFGENVGILTSEIFSLEVEHSGFHELLAKSVKSGLSFDEIIEKYNNQLGFEGRAILSAMIASRERGNGNDKAE